MGFMDDVSRKVKAKAEEWDVQGKAEKLAAEVDKVAHEAKDKAAAYADENRDKVSGALDKAGATIDERTKGQYSDKIVKAKQQVEKGVDKLAEQRPGGPHGPSASPDPGVAGAAAGSGWAGATDSPSAPHPQDAYRPEPYAPEPYRPDPIDPAAPIDEPPAPTTGPTPPSDRPHPTGTGWPV